MKLGKSSMPQRRYGDPPEPLPGNKKVCQCAHDARRGHGPALRYTGEAGRLPNGTGFGKFACPHGNRWTVYKMRKRDT